MSYATVSDIETLWRPLTEQEQDRAEQLLPVVSSLINTAAYNAGKSIPKMIDTIPGYKDVVMAVTVDVTARILRQDTQGEPLSQFNQTALGYNQQGTYAIPGGGMANSLMNNDLKRLGLRRQRVEMIDLYDKGNHNSTCSEDTDWS